MEPWQLPSALMATLPIPAGSERCAARAAAILLTCILSIGVGCDGPRTERQEVGRPEARTPAVGRPPVDSRPIDGRWKVVFLGVQHATVSEHDGRDPFAIDTEPSLEIRDGVLTAKTAGLTETLRIERLDLPDGKAGEIDLDDPDSHNLFLGLVRLDGDRLILRLHMGERPADFMVRPDQDGTLVVAQRVKD